MIAKVFSSVRSVAPACPTILIISNNALLCLVPGQEDRLTILFRYFGPIATFAEEGVDCLCLRPSLVRCYLGKVCGGLGASTIHELYLNTMDADLYRQTRNKSE